MYTYTTVREIADSLNLEILNEGNLDLKIDIPNIYQIGYELVGFLDKDSDELNRYIKTHRTLLFLNQDNKIIDIRNLNLVRKHIPYPYEFYFNRKRKHFMKSKTHVYYRRLNIIKRI